MDKDTLETINVQPKADGPEEVLARKDLGHALEKEIDRLGDSFRSVFILRGVEKMSVRETAEALELSEGTVRTQYHRARQALQRGIEERMAEAQDGVFEFAGTWCDSVVETVLKRIVSINIEDVRQ